MGLSDGRKSFRIGLAVLIQYRSVTASHPASHVAVAITLNAKASSLKIASARFLQVPDAILVTNQQHKSTEGSVGLASDQQSQKVRVICRKLN